MMENVKSAGKNELVRICLIYRFISLAVSTFAYFFAHGGDVTALRLGIACGMIASSIIGARTYSHSLAQQSNPEVTATMCLEVVAYGVIIIFSGGFSSPYLWYSVSSLTVVMAAERMVGRFRIFAPLAALWFFACALLGGNYGLFPGYVAYSGVNTGIAFLVVAGGFYMLFDRVNKLDESRRELRGFNESLRREVARSEQALSHTLSLYESFHLFSITDPDRVMDEITALLCRTITPGGCLLVKISPQREIERTSSKCIPDALASRFIGLLSHCGFMPMAGQDAPKSLFGKYAVTYISNASGIQGVLLSNADLDNNDEGERARRAFYLNLVKIILQELDLQAMVEAYIVCEEQSRIASEIHDTVIQKLFSVACSLHLFIEGQAGMSLGEKTDRLRQITKTVESAMRELREAIYGNRWDSCTADELQERLLRYTGEMKTLSGSDIRLSVDSAMPALTSHQKTALYRIICEAVNNAVRHGKAALIDVGVFADGGSLVAVIADDGEGFDASRPAQSEGAGLANMYKLANLLKGKLIIESKPGAGTTVRCSLPK